jgi:hypothetical protein
MMDRIKLWAVEKREALYWLGICALCVFSCAVVGLWPVAVAWAIVAVGITVNLCVKR